MTSLAEILRLNTRLFRNCLDGLTDEQAGARLSSCTNSATFVAAHVADSRYFILKVLGVSSPSPLAPYLAAAKTIDDVRQWPTLLAIGDAWSRAGHALRDRLDAITAAELDAPSATPFPTTSAVINALAFLVQHESYHVGQLAMLRKHAGLPAMSYS